MNLLLDTHVWLWSVSAPDRLSDAARNAIEDGDSALHVSAASWWEVALLASWGRIEIDGDLDAWLAYATREYPVVERPITAEIAIRSQQIELPHGDPADRFIAATAVCHDLLLVTKDRELRAAHAVPTFEW